jgi:hypothetical protein
MITAHREAFNHNFSAAQYQEFLELLQGGYPPIPIRFAETPVFIPKDLQLQLIAAGEEILKLIKRPDFKDLTAAAIPQEWKVPNENDHPHFLAFDFGICTNEDGSLSPKLIELQGFPSLYGFQAHMAESYVRAFKLDERADFSPYFNGLTPHDYIALLKKVIVGDYGVEEVALMDVDAPNQKTAIDFFITQQYLGIPVLGLTDIVKEGKQLFYYADGRKIQLKRIYNRLIFDEVKDRQELFKQSFDPREELDIEWVTHPDWFYRISKFTLPFLKSEFVPKTYFLNELTVFPEDLENYVLKPLFSFAGHGVIIDLKKHYLEEISDPQNWILQQKVVYGPVIQSPNGMVKVEIRLMYLWPDGEAPVLAINLARLSRGKMIGTQHNTDEDWVGGTVGLMD